MKKYLGTLIKHNKPIYLVFFVDTEGNAVNHFSFLTPDGIVGMATSGEVKDLTEIVSVKVLQPQTLDIPL